MLETERLIIRAWRESDAGALYQICLDPELRSNGIPFFDSIDDALQTILLWNQTDAMRALVHRESDIVIGLIGLGDMNRYSSYMELEFAIAAESRNQGYATEAVRRMIAYGFDDLGLSVICAWVRAHNTASVRILEKCAFTFEGRLRRHARDQSDTLCYSILREEYHAWRDSE